MRNLALLLTQRILAGRERSLRLPRAVLLLALLALACTIPTRGAPAPPEAIWTFDARPLRALDVGKTANARRLWDTMHLLSALQGLVNRDEPKLYLFYCSQFGVDTDEFWFDWFRGEDGWLRSTKVHELESIEETLKSFRREFDGLVVYDPAVPATSNVASTAAGHERLLPVRYDPSPDSLFDLCTRRMRLPVKLRLIEPGGRSLFTGRGLVPHSGKPSSGSAKTDAYRWAVERYLTPDRGNPEMAAYYLDAYWLQQPRNAQADMHTLSNHDYFVAHQAFFMDLSPWGDETPVDDPGQPLGADRRMLGDVLGRLYELSGGAILKIGGFPPWPYKYTTHAAAGRHEPVPTEWEFTRIISQYNAYKEADAAGPGAMANASFYQHYPLAKTYRQPNRQPGLDTWRTCGYVDRAGQVAPRFYVGHYVGDYDSPSWLYKAVPAFFGDPARGETPLAWAFNPNLADRAPQALVYAYRQASTNDFFIAGDSGAGYLNVRALSVRPDSGLPSGVRAWEEHCRGYFERWDMSITGFVLDGSAGAATELEFGAYRSFSPDGLGTHFEPRPVMRAGIPTCPEKDLPDSVEQAAALIAKRAEQSRGRPGFLWARSILKAPRWYADLSRVLNTRYAETDIQVVDPYTFFGLVRLHLAE